MCRLMSAAARANTSSRSSEAFTSSPISASVASTSVEISEPPPRAALIMCSSVGFMDQNYYSRCEKTGRFAGGNPLSTPWSFLACSGQCHERRQERIQEALPFLLLRLRSAPQLQNPDIRQVAVALRIVEPVSDDKFVGNSEAHIIRAHRRNAPLRLVEQHRHSQVF